MLSRLYRNTFVRNVLLVASGTAGAQAATLVFAPLVTRLYGPSAFGILGAFQAILAIVAPLAALTYPLAIVLPSRDAEASRIARLSVCIALVLSVLVAILLVPMYRLAADVLNMAAAGPYILLLPLAMFFSAMQEILKQWLLRKRHFGVTARVTFLQSVIVNSSKAVFGVISPFGSALISIQTCGTAIHASLLWRAMRTRAGWFRKTVRHSFTVRGLRSVAAKYRDFPQYRAPQVLLSGLSYSLPILLLSNAIGPAAAGLYAIARSTLELPSRLVAGAVLDVFYPKAASIANAGRSLTGPVLKATALLMVVGLMPYSLIVVAGPLIFPFVFGAEWEQAGIYARYLSIWLFFVFINRPSVAILPVLGLQAQFLVYELTSAVLRAGALVFGLYYLRNDVSAIILLSISGGLTNIWLIGYALRKSVTSSGRSEVGETYGG